MVASTGTNSTVDFYISSVRDITLSRYLCGCAAVLVIYDWLLLVGDESRTIWKSKWTVPKTLYYLVSSFFANIYILVTLLNRLE
jgi:hypothetical protein